MNRRLSTSLFQDGTDMSIVKFLVETKIGLSVSAMILELYLTQGLTFLFSLTLNENPPNVLLGEDCLCYSESYLLYSPFCSSFSLLLWFSSCSYYCFFRQKVICLCFMLWLTGEALNLHGLEGEGNMLFWPNNGRVCLMWMVDFLMEESSF